MAQPMTAYIIDFRDPVDEIRQPRGMQIVAHFDVQIGPVRLLRCALLYQSGKRYRVWWSDPRRIEVDADVKKAIHDTVRSIHRGEAKAPMIATVEDASKLAGNGSFQDHAWWDREGKHAQR